MEENRLLYTNLAKYYDLIYHDKDYKKEADFVDRIIKNNKIKGKDVIEIACGTGNHTRYFLNKKYNIIAGVDLSGEMLSIYKKKYPGIKTVKADMRKMNLNKKADIILCLFSSISYNTTKKDLRKTLSNCYNHLNKGGILIFDTGFTTFKDKYKNQNYCDSGIDGDKRIVRVNHSVKRGDMLDLYFVYALFHKGKIEVSKDKHTLGIFNKEEFLDELKKVGFKPGNTKLKTREFFYGVK